MRFLIALLAVANGWPQTFTQRGYFEGRFYCYPQTAPNDSSHLIGEAALHYELIYKPAPAFRIFSAIEADTDTHQQTERSLRLDWLDRSLQRPAFAIRRLSASYSSGPLTIEVGKQFIRWGKADILNPTDRFAPRDFLNVVQADYLAVTAARLTYGNQANTIEVVAVPLFTPSRTPLLNQRWGVALPRNLPVADLPSRFPGGTQVGARWNHIGQAAEFSFSFFDGYQHLPSIEGDLAFRPLPVAEVRRFYPKLRTYGADLALPLRPVTLKMEAAYFAPPDPGSARYLLYVVQLERQSGEWSFVGGYSGEVVTRPNSAPAFDAERGFSRAFLGRAGYTIDANRSAAVEAAIRQNGRGASIKAEYSEGIGQHWRVTGSAAVIRGEPDDFLGQYRHNSYLALVMRYSF